MKHTAKGMGVSAKQETILKSTTIENKEAL